MAEWVVVILPLAGALLGVLLTMGIQERVSRLQREFDREAKFFDVKKDAYIKYGPTILQLQTEIRKLHRPIATAHNAVSAIPGLRQASIDAIAALTGAESPEDLAKNAAQLLQHANEMSDLSFQATEALAELEATIEECASRIRSLKAEINTARTIFAIFACDEVLHAADALDSLWGADDDRLGFEAEIGFVKAIQKDLRSLK
jgi:methyl-accepting chemotaxis protein